MALLQPSKVLLILFLQYATTFAKNGHMVYNYEADVYGKTTLDDGITAYYGIFGKIDFYVRDLVVFAQFRDLETTVYNGPLENLKSAAKRLPMTDEFADLYKPFVLYYDEDYKVIEIGVKSDDDDWSVNMKRSVASILQAKNPMPSGKVGDVETNLYGKCTANYDVQDDGKYKVVTKTLINCTESDTAFVVGKYRHNCEWKLLGDIIHRDIKRVYTIDTAEHLFKDVKSFSNVTLKKTPRDRRQMQYIQRVQFTYQDNPKTEFSFDVSEFTNTSLYYETNFEETLPTGKTMDELVTQLKESMDKYLATVYEPLKNFDFKTDAIEKIYMLLSQIFIETKDLKTDLKPITEVEKYNNIFQSLFPYMLSEKVLPYMKEQLQSEEMEPIIAALILPKWIFLKNVGNEKLLKELEYLLDLPDTTRLEVVFNAIINFAGAVHDMKEANKITNDVFQKYVNYFIRKWKETKDYGMRMAYMLAVANLAPEMDPDVYLPLIADVHEDRRIRTLAGTAFKVKSNNFEKAYKYLWPVVSNKTENLQVRVAALDIILSSEVCEENIKKVLNDFSKYPTDLKEQHLYNFLYTSVDRLGEYENVNIPVPKSYRAMGTSNIPIYRYDSRDEFGTSLDMISLAEPNSNDVDTIIVTSDDYAMSLNVGKHTFYIKAEGIDNALFEKIFNFKDKGIEAIPQLLKLIEENNFKLKKSQDVHIDLVIFNEGRASIAYHADQKGFGTLFDLILSYLMPEGVSIPTLFFVNVPSELGTAIEYVNAIETKFIFNNTEPQIMEDGNVNMNVYTRLEYTSDVELSFSYPGEHFGLTVEDVKDSKVQFVVPVPGLANMDYFKWQNDNLTFRATIDYAVATIVSDEDKLKQYCSTCDSVQPISENNIKHAGKVIPFEAIGLTFHLNGSLTQYDWEDDKPEQGYSSSRELFSLPRMLYYLHKSLYEGHSRTASISIKSVPTYENSETSLAFDFQKEKENDAHGKAILTYENRNIDDGKVLQGWNLTASYYNNPKHVQNKILESNLTVSMEYFHDGTTTQKDCWELIGTYPSWRKELFTLTPAKQTEFQIIYKHGKQECEKEARRMILSASVSDEQVQYAKSLPEYNLCQAQKMLFDYYPPSEECIKLSNIFNEYRQYEVRDIKEGKIPESGEGGSGKPTAAIMLHPEKGTYASMSKSGREFSNYPKYLVDMFLLQPYDTLRFNGLTKYGIHSTCFITPRTIKTFNDKELSTYDINLIDKTVALVECTNTSRIGLVFSKLGPKYLAFKLWIGDTTLSATRSSDKLQAILNGKLITTDEKIETDNYMVRVMDESTLLFTNDDIKIYYTTEYLAIRVFSEFNPTACGLCTYEY